MDSATTETTGVEPALSAEPRPVHESTSLPTDYPARGGVPQCLASATKPVELAPGVWEVQAGLPMEARASGCDGTQTNVCAGQLPYCSAPGTGRTRYANK